MKTVQSADGTPIAYEETGTGPLLILVPGVFNDHQRLAGIAELMAANYTVINYDRRGRGNSEDNSPYSLDREVEDLDALIATHDGPAFAFGYSSGALLALLAVGRGSNIAKVAAYEPPPVFEDDEQPNLADQLKALVDEGRTGDAVELFQTRAVGLPAEVVGHIKQSPMWPGLVALAASTVYDALLIQPDTLTPELLATVTVPTLVLSGAATWPNLTQASAALAASLPAGEHQVLEGGEGHDPDTTPLEPALRSFFE